VSKQLKRNITQDCAWRTMTDQKRLLLGSYGGPAVADEAHCMIFFQSLPKPSALMASLISLPNSGSRYLINQLTAERSCELAEPINASGGRVRPLKTES